MARREWIALPYELTRESGPRLDPMSLRVECDHLVIELALRRPRRQTVITPRLASIPNFLLKAFLFLFVRFSQASPLGPTLGTLFFPGQIHSTIGPGAAFSSNLVRHRHGVFHFGVKVIVGVGTEPLLTSNGITHCRPGEVER